MLKLAAFRITVLSMGLLFLGSAYGDNISLQEFGINVNGVVTDTGTGANPFTVSGVNASGFNQSTGLGVLTFTFDPGKAGTYYVNWFLDSELSVPFYNEFGMVNGTLPSGVSYQIDDPWSGSIYSNFSQNSLNDTNSIPGGVDNYLNNCSGPNCDGDVSLALGFSFTLTANEYAVVTIDTSTTNPGGFNLEQVHPIDANNPAATEMFLSGGVNIQPINSNTPEPGSLVLVAIAGAIGWAVALWRKRSTPFKGGIDA